MDSGRSRGRQALCDAVSLPARSLCRAPVQAAAPGFETRGSRRRRQLREVQQESNDYPGHFNVFPGCVDIAEVAVVVLAEFNVYPSCVVRDDMELDFKPAGERVEQNRCAELVELSSPPTRAAELVELSSPPTRLVHCVPAGSLVDLQCAAELVVLLSPPTRSVHATAAAARAEALALEAIAKLPAAAQAAAHPPPRPGAVQPAAAGAAAPPGFKTGRGAARQRQLGSWQRQPRRRRRPPPGFKPGELRRRRQLECRRTMIFRTVRSLAWLVP